MVACGSSPVTRVSLSPLPCEKRSAWGGGWPGFFSVHHSKMQLSAIMVWILEYFFFAKFTVLTWFANHSVIRLRKVAFFGAKKTLVFFHLPAVCLPRIPDNCFVTSLSYFSVGRMTHFAQTMFGFSSTWMRSCIGKLYRLFTTLGFVMCTVSGSIRRWNKISNSFNCSYPGSDLFR